ncbi:MAG TPA: helix-turn-helix domain-containing protein [Kineosporiaceae bacterium]|nr:helix-turn-helix domain-containing protein [Kineosporiaceae bacterium]
MPRPQMLNVDDVLDAVEALVVDEGLAAVTARAVSRRAGVSNGSLYHSFGSIENVLARAWLRGARRFLDQQQQAIDLALAADGSVDAVTGAALTLAVLADRHPSTARFLAQVKRERLLEGSLDDQLARELQALDGQLLSQIRALAKALWGRRDAAAITVVTACIVDLPTALLLRDLRRGVPGPLSRRLLEQAVRALVAEPPERRGTNRIGAD